MVYNHRVSLGGKCNEYTVLAEIVRVLLRGIRSFRTQIETHDYAAQSVTVSFKLLS
jgi:hypothetical protein